MAELGSIRENKLELVERLADDLAHEIKNPLHAMVINLEVLRRRLARLENEDVQDLLRYAGILGNELDKVSERVDLLLRMVRPAAGSGEYVPVSEVLDELHAVMDFECRRRDVAFQVETPELIPRPQMPRDLTRQMLLSILLAALDITPQGETLRVVAHSEADEVRIEISTPGQSSSAANGQANGQSYVQVARSLVEKLGGTFSTSDTPFADHSAGTAFLVCLPVGS